MDAKDFIQKIKALSHLSEDQVSRTAALAELMSPAERTALCTKLTTLNTQLSQAVSQIQLAQSELKDIEKDARGLVRSKQEAADHSEEEQNALNILANGLQNV